MKVITAPEEYDREEGKLTIFLAGCAGNDWRKEFVKHFKNKDDYVFLDPKRDNWGEMPEEELKKQIAWEMKYLKHNNGIVFMFNDPVGVCPITLLEYGLWGMSDNMVFTSVCITPDYPKRLDLITQTNIICPWRKITSNMDELVKDTNKMMKAWYE